MRYPKYFYNLRWICVQRNLVQHSAIEIPVSDMWYDFNENQQTYVKKIIYANCRSESQKAMTIRKERKRK